MRQVKHLTTLLIVGAMITGCATDDSAEPIQQFGNANKAYQMKNKLLVGSRQDDARVVYDIGKILKVWISPYYQAGTLIAGHDNYVVVKKPSFIVGQSVQKEGTRPNGLVTPTGDFPFVLRGSELDRNRGGYRFSNKNIKRFNNDVYKVNASRGAVAEQRVQKANSKFDKEILNFVEDK